MIKINASATGEVSPLVHHWSVCVGAGRANEGLRAGWLEHLELVRRHCGFQYCRFHGLFHDDMFVYRVRKGRVVYNWQYVDELFDRMLAIGVRPFVELGFCPGDLAGGDETVFWWKGRISPPKDLQAWAELVERFVRHCVERYGLDEVRQWYFEVWNEPNLQAFFGGTRDDYFALYAASARAVKAVDPRLRVGGPATSNFVATGRFDGPREDRSRTIAPADRDRIDAMPWRGVWIESFLQFCEAEGLPVDFVSTHPYPTEYALDEKGNPEGLTRSVDSTRQDLQWLRDAVAASAFANAEIHLTEWSSSPSSRDRSHDCLPAACYVVKCNLDAAGLTDSLSYWTFTDVFEEGGAGDEAFHGGFGLVNLRGVVKPTFHAYRFLNALGDGVLARAEGGIVTRHGGPGGRLTGLAWNYPSEYPKAVEGASSHEAALAIEATGSPRRLRLQIDALPPDAPVLLQQLDSRHGNVVPLWRQLNAGANPTPAQLEMLRREAWQTDQRAVRADAEGTLHLEVDLPPWSVLLIDQQPA